MMQLPRGLPAVALVFGLLAGPVRAQDGAVEADAGDDIVDVRCAGRDGTRVTLDGSGSLPSDATYTWSAPGVRFNDPSSATPTGLFPLGVTTVQLEVSVEGGASDTDTVEVAVVDDSPPTISARAFPGALWPPDHKMHDVRLRIGVSDNCSDAVSVVLTSVTSNEPDDGNGDGNTVNDIQGAEIGSDDRDISLRAERMGNGAGRVYTLRYQAEDASGNHSDAVARVLVPHDQGHSDDAADHRPPYRPETPDAAVCPLPADAVDQWAEILPDPDDSETERACLLACRGWTAGCAQISFGSLACTRSEKMGLYFVKLMRCFGISDPASRQECLVRAREKLSELRGVLGEFRETRTTCRELSEDCRLDCAGAF